jgi:DNA recombination protein RmuC
VENLSWPVLVAIALGVGALGVLLGWLLGARSGGRALTLLESETRRREEADRSWANERQRAAAAASEAAVAKERANRAHEQIEEQRRFLETARGDLENSFRSLSAAALQGSTEQFLALAEQRLATSRALAVQDLDERRAAIETVLSPVRESLERLDQKTSALERDRVEAYSRLETHVRSLANSTEGLQSRTMELANALRGSSQQRGRWGEIALKNVVELAGLSEYSDFQEQVSIEGGRPDLVVRLPGKRFIAVDAKAPLTAYLEASEATSDEARKVALMRHARDLRNHVKALAQRDYAAGLDGSLDLVVLFLPGDPYLSAAATTDPELQLGALRSKVLIATPTTLLALLRTAAHFWQQNALAENAQKIGEVARLLHERVGVFTEHLSKVGNHLEKATRAYNDAVGSFESRLRPLGTRLDELRVAEGSRQKIESPQRVDVTPRVVTKAVETAALPFDED